MVSIESAKVFPRKSKMDNKKRTLRWWDILAATLLISCLWIAASRLEATEWSRNLEIVQVIVILGAILGLALGKSIFSPRIVTLLGLAYGTIIITWRLGNTLNQNLILQEQLYVMQFRLFVSLAQLINREIVKDYFLFLTLMAILFWLLSVHSGYTLVRYGNGWLAVIPSGFAILIIQSFDPFISGRIWFLALFLFLALLVVTRIELVKKEQTWKATETVLPQHLGFEFIRFTIIAVSVVIILAWSFPALAKSINTAKEIWQPVQHAWNLTRDRMEYAFASIGSNTGMVSHYYGKSALLGRGNILEDTVVFFATPSNPPPNNLRYYWRARTYDNYEDGQWFSTKTSATSYNPEKTILSHPNYRARWTDTVMFSGSSHMSTLYTPPQPQWISSPSILDLVKNPDDTVDIVSFRASPALNPGQGYASQASLPNASINQLRNAGDNYPEWVLERYLQLPDSVTTRTRQLALDITEGLDTPFDKAVAITNYLRNNIEYADSIESLPLNQEAIDWFLFDYKKGFCNYYATSEVIMLRSLGIPARWSIGYAQGERQEEGGYLVRQFDAHAWPEVYFPDYGWVEFEPTVSQPEIIRVVEHPLSSSNPSASSNSNQNDEIERDLEELKDLRGAGLVDLSDFESRNQINYLYLIFFLVVTSVVMYLSWRYRLRMSLQTYPLFIEKAIITIGFKPPEWLLLWARRSQLSSIEKSYQEINYALNRLGKRPKVNDTPSQRAETISRIIPLSKEPAQQVVAEYHIGTFGRNQPDFETAEKAASQIRTLSYKKRLRDILRTFRNVFPK